MKNFDEIQRWYDSDPVVLKCINVLKNIEDSQKNQLLDFLMNEVIFNPPYHDPLPEDLHTLISKEKQKRRWYDYNRIARVFMKLLKYSSESNKKEIARKTVEFIENLQDKNNL